MNLWEQKILGCSFCSKVTTTLFDQVVDLHREGSATNKISPSSSLSRHCLIHEFGDLDKGVLKLCISAMSLPGQILPEPSNGLNFAS